METQLNIDLYETTEGALEQIAQKLAYLEYIDTDMEAFYSIKAEALCNLES